MAQQLAAAVVRGAALAEQQLLAFAVEHALAVADFSAPTQQALPPLAQQAASFAQQSASLAAALLLAARLGPTVRATTDRATRAQEQIKTRFVHMEFLLEIER
ncbi:MAG TPA: hypothetical protein VGN12_28690 [Pirellulales bacterium]